LNDAEFEFQRERVTKALAAWSPVFGLENWLVEFKFNRGPADGQSPDSPAVSWPLWEYMTARIEFNLTEIARLNQFELENVVIHELLHLVTEEAVGGNTGSLERVVSHLSRILQRTQAQPPKPWARQRKGLTLNSAKP